MSTNKPINKTKPIVNTSSASPASAGKTAQAKKPASAVVPALAKKSGVNKAQSSKVNAATAKASATASKPKQVPVVVIASKAKKSKLIRDSFTIPEHEYKLIQVLKERAHKHGLPLKKSELLRAGILKLIELKDDMFLKAISSVDIIKTGRPAKLK